MRKAEEHGDGRQGTAYPGERAPSTPTLDPAFVIGWHIGKAAADRELAAERNVEQRVSEYLRGVGRMAA